MPIYGHAHFDSFVPPSPFVCAPLSDVSGGMHGKQVFASVLAAIDIAPVAAMSHQMWLSEKVANLQEKGSTRAILSYEMMVGSYVLLAGSGKSKCS